MNKILILITGIVFITFSWACKKKSSDAGLPEYATRSINGSVDLPGANLSGWTVTGNFSETTLSGTSYNGIVSANDIDFQFVSDASGKVMLMGVTYPGQTDFSISPSSSVVAVIMSTPIIASLTTQGQVNLINSIKSEAVFKETVEALSSALQGGKGLLDTTNLEFQIKLGTLFEQAASKTTSHWKPNVNTIVVGNQIMFQNPGHAFAQVVGVYKDGSKLQQFLLERYEFFGVSITDVLTGDMEPVDPIEKLVKFETDGEYQVKVRTGRPDAGYGESEALEAMGQNLANIVLDHLGLLIKMPKANWCLEELRGMAGQEISAAVKSLIVKPANVYDFKKMAYNVAGATLNGIAAAAEGNCWKSKVNFFSKTGELLFFLDPVSKWMQFQNDSWFMKDWIKAHPTFDTCFLVKNGKITQCGAVDVTFTPQTLSPTYAAQNLSFDMVMSPDSAWTITTDQSWLTLNKTSGTGDATIGFSITENSSTTTARTADIIVKVNGNSPETLKVVQSAMNISLTLTPNVINASATGTVATVRIDVDNNMAWTAVSGFPSMISIVGPTSGTGDYDLTLDIKPNTGSNAQARTGVLAVNVNGYSVNASVTVNQAGGGVVNPSLTGIWTIDLQLGSGVCDETLLEDEAGIPPTFHFNPGGTITFDTDPVGSDLNEPEFTNTYTYSNGTLTIKSHLLDLPNDNIMFEASLVFDQSSGKFVGTYTNTWTDNTVCSGSVTVYK